MKNKIILSISVGLVVVIAVVAGFAIFSKINAGPTKV